ncbi:MAG: flavodoxin family protein [Chloroflexota bacterium]|nr:flavodoxin family protein [Chloroflexota bacterium]
MKILVAYQSVSGNTKKIAEAIYSEIEGDKELKAIGEIDGLGGYDLSFIGFPIHAYGPANEAKAFFESNAAGKNIALFITHASSEDEPLVEPWLDTCRAAASGANIVGLFHCRGELAENVADMMLNSGDPQLADWAGQRDDTLGQPDAERLERAPAG